MLTYTAHLDVAPGKTRTTVWLTQYSSNFQIEFWLFASAGVFTIEPGTTAFIRGLKPDGKAYSADAVSVDTTRNVVVVSGDTQITAVAGSGNYELVLVSDGAEEKLCTANFTIRVQSAAMDMDTIASDSALRELVFIEDHFAAIIAAGAQYEGYQAAISDAQSALESTANAKVAAIQNAATAGQSAVMSTAASVQATVLQSIQTNKTQVLTEMRGQFDVNAIEAAAQTATAKALEAKRRASSAANYASQAETSANAAAASATRATVGAGYADSAQDSAIAAAASAQLAANKAAEVLALEIGRRSGLSAEEVLNLLTQLVQEQVSQLTVPDDLTYDDHHLLRLAKDNVPIGTGVTITGGSGGGGGGSSGGTWGEFFGI